jgi:hypothetical protein
MINKPTTRRESPPKVSETDCPTIKVESWPSSRRCESDCSVQGLLLKAIVVGKRKGHRKNQDEKKDDENTRG